jgi:hypothetical protein
MEPASGKGIMSVQLRVESRKASRYVQKRGTCVREEARRKWPYFTATPPHTT